MSKHGDYPHDLKALQLALVRWQGEASEGAERVVVVLEGRDAAGKDGAIKRIVEAYPGRGGDLDTELRGDRVLLFGGAVTVMESRLRITA